MALVPRRAEIYQGQPGTGNGTLYTAPSAATTVGRTPDTVTVVTIWVTNTTGTAATVTLDHVPSGGSAGVSKRLLAAVSIAANTTYQIDNCFIVLAAGDTLQGLQGTASAITLSVYGEIDP